MKQRNRGLRVYPRSDRTGVSVLERKRILAGLSTSGLANMAGISRNSVWRIEGNHHSGAIRPDTALKIVRALSDRLSVLGEKGCSFGDLFQLIDSR